MDFLQLASNRYSVRRFTGEAIKKEDLKKILEAGHLAPTAKNIQPHRIFVLDSELSLTKLRKCTPCDYGTRTAIVICYDTNLTYKRSYDGKDSGDIDASIVTTHLMLEAASIGIGSTWVMNFDPKILCDEFNFPSNIIPTAILVMGYIPSDSEPSPRHSEFRPLEEIVTYL